jgi:hypothetical protein
MHPMMTGIRAGPKTSSRVPTGVFVQSKDFLFTQVQAEGASMLTACCVEWYGHVCIRVHARRSGAAGRAATGTMLSVDLALDSDRQGSPAARHLDCAMRHLDVFLAISCALPYRSHRPRSFNKKAAQWLATFRKPRSGWLVEGAQLVTCRSHRLRALRKTAPGWLAIFRKPRSGCLRAATPMLSCFATSLEATP